MVVIDAHDVGKSREQVLLYLIFEATGQVIPLEKVKFGKPQEVDPRKDLDTDPNTFIPCQVDQQYDDRYWVKGSGFLYRRRCILNHVSNSDLHHVSPTHLPFKISDVLEQINRILPYPIAADDIIDYEYLTLDDVYKGLRLQAHPESLLWINGTTFKPNTEWLEGGPLIGNPDINGFNEYAAPAV
ncbi:hypothetical protein [Ralstonia phage RP31]|uniref:Uncharacterized protein n=2 Tax=Ripduovirus RP12 TaxID=2560700 RepID=A0A1L7N181_9CAUD|nr:hypothetical protein FDH28_gp070 [Ralstonia phage RP12]BAW19044.1 hypothetical protein [Ralstonia phage RP12]BAW19329.1 hypothetical protein [Ralstonia phage RP31]